MARIRESVQINASAERVWKAVHDDLKNARKWTDHLKKVEVVGGGKAGKGSTVRYYLDLPGGVQVLEVLHKTWQPPKKCAGPFTDGPLKGTWSGPSTFGMTSASMRSPAPSTTVTMSP